jgi:transketolase
VRTIIGYGSPKAGTNKVHGEALGAEAVAATKKFFGFPEDQSFYVPDEALANWRKAVDRGAGSKRSGTRSLKATRRPIRSWPRSLSAPRRMCARPAGRKAIPSFPAGKPQATRNAGGAVMNAIAEVVPELFGGAADLTSSTKTIFKPGASFHVDPTGRNVFFGVREFGMCAAVNGMAAHGGLIPFGSTFFTFSDYCKPAIRLAALMKIRTRCSSSRTTRSAWAKTGPRISRSST